MKRIDVNVLLGHWPFRKLYKEGLSNMKAYFKEEGVELGLVSSVNSTFYNDAFEGDEELYEEIGNDKAFKSVMTINPKVPGWREDLENGIKKFNICAVKVFPGIHGYRLEDAIFWELVNVLEEKQIPIMVAQRLEDERNTYLYVPTPLDTEALKVFGKKAKTPVIFLHLLTWEVGGLGEIFDGNHDCYFDTSGLRGATFPIEEMLRTVKIDTIMFGTQYPMLSEKASTYIVDRAEISAEDKEKILYKNAERVFGL
jgi:Predicted metal-dependent hydrolase of the TIM-barrel fold